MCEKVNEEIKVVLDKLWHDIILNTSFRQPNLKQTMQDIDRELCNFFMDTESTESIDQTLYFLGYIIRMGIEE